MSGDSGIIGEEKALAELASEFGMHPAMTSTWKQELMKRASDLFSRGSKPPAAEDAQKVIDDLHCEIGWPLSCVAS